MDDSVIIKTECRSSGTTRSPNAGTLVAPVADNFVNVKKESSWYQEEQHDLVEENETKLLKTEPSWYQEEEHDLVEENETKLHIVKSEYEVQDNWWHSDWNDVKEEHDGREGDDSNVEDDDSMDGDYIDGSSDGEFAGDGDRKEDCVDDNCKIDYGDFDVGSESLDQSNLAIAGNSNKKPEHRDLIHKYYFEAFITRDCAFCGMVFDSIYPWKRHMDEEHNFSTRDGSYYNYVDVNHAKCKTCNAVIRNRIHALRVHVVQHLPYTKIFKCKTCSYTNSTADRVRKHIKNKHFELLQTELTERKLLRNCVYCSDYVGSVKKLSQHIRKEHIHTFKHKMTLVCPACGESFPRELSWKNHLQRKHQFDTLKGISFENITHPTSEDAKESSKFRCLNCRRTFGSTYLHYQLMSHAFKHLPYKSYKCTFCNYDCLNKHNVIAHTCENLLTEIESKPYLKEKPTSIKYIPLKRKTEIIDKLFVCPSCEKHFESVTLWSDHLTKVHHFDKIENLNIEKIDEENSTRNYKCLICDKVFLRQDLAKFQMHAFTHMPHMWTKCKFCLTPIHSHTKCTCKWKSKNVKLAFIAYFCPRCGKELGSAQRWESHIVSEHNLRYPTKLNFCKINEIDNEDPLYKCELCDEYIKESASSSDLLFNHATSKHMPFKSYKCKNCAESFENMKNILTHLDGCNTYDENQLKNVLEKARCQCSLCGYLGKSNDDVDTHFSKEHKFISVNHPNFSWICIICDLKCNSKETIVEHISKKHIAKLHQDDNSRIKFLCPVTKDCPAALDSKHEWRSHVSIHHAFNTDEELGMKKSGNVWNCLECGKLIKQRWARLTHKFIHFTDLRFQCRKCDATYSNLKSTRQHTLRCTGQQTSAFSLKIKQMARDRIKETSEEQKSNNLENTEQAESSCHADPLKVDENTLQTSMATEKSVLLNEFEKYVTFACPECNIPLDTKTDWHAHISKNHDFFLDNNLNITSIPGMKNKSACNECGCKIHGSSLHAQRHKLTHMPYSAFVCRLCNHRSKTQNVLIYHIQRQHLRLGTYPCYFCDWVCQTNVERYDHIKSQHKGVNLPENVCEICMKSLSCVSKKELHMATHDFNRTTFPCGYCSVKYLDEYSRRNHWIQLHPVEYEAQLAELPIARNRRNACDRRKETSEEQNSNNLENTEQAESSCHADPLKVDENTLQTSMATEKSVLLNGFEKYVTFACPECNIPLDTKTDWHAHISKNHDFFLDNNLNITSIPGMKNKSACNECGCKIHGSSLLVAQRHKLTHMPYSAFVCRLCNHRSKTQNVLIYHIQRQHLKLGTYPCYFCDLVCQTNVERSDHIKSQHNGVNLPKNVCEICMKSLSCVSKKEQHMATHDFNRTTLPCGYCSVKYLDEYSRRNHWKQLHPVEYEAKLAELPIARKVESKKKCDRKKPSSTRVKRKAYSDDSDDSTYSPIKKLKSSSSGPMLLKEQQDLRKRRSTRLKKKAHSDDSEKPQSTKNVPKSKNSSKVTNDVKTFDVDPDFEGKSEPDIQHPLELEFEPVARNAETKNNCKSKKSSNITRVREEFLSCEDFDDSTYSPIEKPKSTKKVPKSKNSSKVTNDIKKFDGGPDFEVKEEFFSYEDSDENTHSPIKKPNLKRKQTRKNVTSRTARVVEKNNVKCEPESESE